MRSASVWPKPAAMACTPVRAFAGIDTWPKVFGPHAVTRPLVVSPTENVEPAATCLNNVVLNAYGMADWYNVFAPQVTNVPSPRMAMVNDVPTATFLSATGLRVTVAVGVMLTVGDAVFVAVRVSVMLTMEVRVAERVIVAVDVPPLTGVALREPVAVGNWVCVWVCVRVRVFVCVETLTAVAVDVTSGSTVRVAVCVYVRDGVVVFVNVGPVAVGTSVAVSEGVTVRDVVVVRVSVMVLVNDGECVGERVDAAVAVMYRTPAWAALVAYTGSITAPQATTMAVLVGVPVMVGVSLAVSVRVMVGVSVCVGVCDDVGVCVSKRMPLPATAVVNVGSVTEPYGNESAVFVWVAVCVGVAVFVPVVVAVAVVVGVVVYNVTPFPAAIVAKLGSTTVPWGI